MTFSKWFNGREVRQGASRAQRRRRAPGFVRLRVEALEDRTLLTVTPTLATAWIPEGPGPIINAQNVAAQPGNAAVGAVESLAVAHPRDSAGNVLNIVYAGSVNGGVWRTDDLSPPASAQPHWTPLTDAQPSLAVSSLALDPLDSSGNTLWVGTGPLSSSVSRADLQPEAQGLLKTTDGRNPTRPPSWTVLGGQALQGHRILSIVPTTIAADGTTIASGGSTANQVVLVAGLDGLGVQRSTDGGQTFTPVPDLPWDTTDLVVDPKNPNRFWAAVPGHGVFVSNINEGQTWTNIDDGTLGTAQATNIKLAVVVASDGSTTILYAAVAGQNTDPSNPNLVYLSGVFQAIAPGGGATWSMVGASPPQVRTSLNAGHFALAADPSKPNQVYVSGLGNQDTVPQIYVADTSAGPGNAGWNRLFAALTGFTRPHVDSRHLAFLDPTTLLEADDGGVYALHTNSADPSGQWGAWMSVNGDLQTTEFYRIAYDPVHHTIFGGAQDNGSVIQASPGSHTWNLLPAATGDGSTVEIGVGPGGTVVHYYNSNGIPQRDGQQLQLNGLAPDDLPAVKKGVTNTGFAPFTLAFSPSPLRILLGSGNVTLNHLYESMDGGDTLKDVTPPGMTGTPTAFTYTLPGLGSTEPSFYVASKTGELFYHSVFEGPFGPQIVNQKLDTPPWDAGTYARQIEVTFDGNNLYLLDTQGHIWHGIFGTSVSWTDLTYQLYSVASGSPVIRIALAASNGDGGLLAAGRNGVFHLLGQTWSLVGGGLPNVEVTDVQYVPFDPTDPNGGDFLLAGTFGRGAFILPHASANLAVPFDSLLVTGDEHGVTDDTIVVRLNQDNPQLLQIVVNGTVEFNQPYTTLRTIRIDGGGGKDTIDIEDLPGTNNLGFVLVHPTAVTIHGSPGDDFFSVDQTGAQTVTVDHENNNGESHLFQITGLDSQDSVTLDGGAGNNHYDDNLDPGMDFTLNVGGSDPSATNRLIVNASQFFEQTFVQTNGLVLTGNGGLNVTGSSLTATAFEVLGGQPAETAQVNFSGSISQINAVASAGADNHIVIDGTPAPLEVYGGGNGNDTFDILDNLRRVLLHPFGSNNTFHVNLDGHNATTPGVNGGGGTTEIDDSFLTGANTLQINDQHNHAAANESTHYTLDDSTSNGTLTHTLTRTASNGTVTYTDTVLYHSYITQLELNASDANSDAIDVNRLTVPTEIDTSSGSNTVYVTPDSQDLANLLTAKTSVLPQADLTVVGGGPTAVVINDQKSPGPSSTYEVSSGLQAIHGVFTAGLLMQRAAAGEVFLSGDDSVTLNGSNGTAVYNVESTVAGIPVTLNTGPGNNEVDVAPINKSLTNLQAGLVIQPSSTGQTSVSLDDSADTASATYTITGSTVQASGAAVVTYAGATSLTVKGGSGKNQFLLGDASDPLSGLPRQLTIEGGGAGDSLILDDEANQPYVSSFLGDTEAWAFGSSPSYEVSQSAIAYTNLVTTTHYLLGPGRPPVVADTSTTTTHTQINYANVSEVTIHGTTPQSLTLGGFVVNTGATANVFKVIGYTDVPVSADVTIDAGNAGDQVNVGILLEDVSAVTVNGGTGTTLTLDDRLNIPISFNTSGTGFNDPKITHPQYTITDQAVLRTDKVTTLLGSTVVTYNYTTLVAYQNVASVLIQGGESDDTYTVNSTHANTPVTIDETGTGTPDGTAGNNTVSITPDTQDLSNLKGDLTIKAGPAGTGQTTVFVHDENNPGAPGSPVKDSYHISARGFRVGDPVNINLSNVAAVTLYGAASAAYDVENIPAGTTVTINPGAGPNHFSIVPGLQNFFLNGLNTGDLTIDDSGDTANATYTITPTTVQVSGFPAFTYAGATSLTVTGGSGTDTFNVQGTAAATPVTLNTGAGTVNVGSPANSLGGLLGALTVTGGGGAATLNFNSAGDTGLNYLLTATTLSLPANVTSVSGPPLVTFTGIATVVLNTGTGSTTTNDLTIIRGVAAGTALTLNSGPNNIISVGNSTNALDDIHGPVLINGQASDGFVVADEGSQTGHTYTLSALPALGPTANQLSRSDPLPLSITYTGLPTLQMGGSSAVGGDTFNIESLAGNYLTHIYGGPHAVYNLSPMGQNLDALSGILELNGAAPGVATGNSVLSINDQHNAAASTWIVESNAFVRSHADGSSALQIYFAAFSSATVNGGSGGNTFNVLGTAAAIPVTLNTGAGTNTVNVGDSRNTLEEFLGTLTVNGQNGNNTLNLNDQGELDPATQGQYYPYHNEDDTWWPAGSGLPARVDFLHFPAGVLAQPGVAKYVTTSLYWQNVQQIVFTDPVGGSTVTHDFLPNALAGTHLTLHGGTLNDILFSGAAAGQPQTFTVTGPNTGTVGNISYTGVNYLLSFGAGQATFKFLPGGSELILNGDGSPAVLDLSALTTPTTVNLPFVSGNVYNVGSVPGVIPVFVLMTSVVGASGDTLVGGNAANTWSITGSNAGQVGGVTFSGFSNLTGGSQADTFAFVNGGSVTGAVNGGGGVNALDYSAYVGDIVVDLALGTATAVSGGIANIQNVTGSQGDDLLVGDANANVLLGGTGRNIIIGGAGGDTITGGGGDNILIGGRSAYDTNLTALDALFAEWTNPTLTIGLRSAALKKGIVVNGQTYALNKSTVFADAAPDRLIGGAGINWFFVDFDDTINNGAGPGPNDRITHV
jgi:hypothetical protein